MAAGRPGEPRVKRDYQCIGLGEHRHNVISSPLAGGKGRLDRRRTRTRYVARSHHEREGRVTSAQAANVTQLAVGACRSRMSGDEPTSLSVQNSGGNILAPVLHSLRRFASRGYGPSPGYHRFNPPLQRCVSIIAHGPRYPHGDVARLLIVSLDS